MLLIHPPVAKPCEPPGGIARLSGALTAHGIRHKLLDANIEALLYTLQNTEPAHGQHDKWTSRTFRNLADNLAAIKDQCIYQNIDRYKRAVIDLNHVVETALNNNSTVSYLNLAIFNMPVRGAEIAEFETSSFNESDLSLYTDFVHPKGWNRKQVRQFLNNEFRKHKAVAEIIKKDPPIFTSNHAPFFES